MVATTGCGAASTPTIYSEVSSFHQLPRSTCGLTFAVAPFQDQEGSLEFESYAERVRAHLQSHGLIVAPLERAGLVVFLRYAIDSGKELVSSYPIIGQTGTSSSETTGSVQRYGNFATYSSQTTYTPTYGVVATAVTSRTEYMRVLRMDILERESLARGHVEKVFESTVRSSGSSGQLSAIVPAMIEAVFARFPGGNGEVRTVALAPPAALQSKGSAFSNTVANQACGRSQPTGASPTTATSTTPSPTRGRSCYTTPDGKRRCVPKAKTQGAFNTGAQD